MYNKGESFELMALSSQQDIHSTMPSYILEASAIHAVVVPNGSAVERLSMIAHATSLYKVQNGKGNGLISYKKSILLRPMLPAPILYRR